MNTLSRCCRPATALAAVLTLACGPATTPEEATPADTPTDESKPVSVDLFEVHDPSFHDLIPADARIDVLAEGYSWSEGPVWVKDGAYLLFSDVPQNVIHRWSETDGAQPWIRSSGYTDSTPRGGEPGSNGLAIDADGNLVLCQHGDRRLARLRLPVAEQVDGPHEFVTVADRFDGKRFHSPNDLVIHPSGDIYFTDPPYGLDGGPESPQREMEHHGVYRVATDGSVTLLYADLTRPNGIALSPDGKTLYMANSDPEQAVWMAWSLSEDGQLRDGKIFYDATATVSEERPGLPDGMAVDESGNVFATGPGGVWVFNPEGRHLGTLRLADPTANCTFGDDGRSLFLTSNNRLLRIRLATRGLEFQETPDG